MCLRGRWADRLTEGAFGVEVLDMLEVLEMLDVLVGLEDGSIDTGN